MLFGKFGLGKVNFGKTCVESQNFDDFGLKKAQIRQSLSRKRRLVVFLM